jgi:peptidoglycan/LPS O-acetylase OafA/YrhL
MRVCLTLVVVAFILRLALVVVGVHWKVAYVLPFTRMDSLALGAWAAMLVRDHSNSESVARVGRRLMTAGLLLLVPVIAHYGWLAHGKPATQIIGYTGLILAGAGLILLVHCAPPTSMLRRVFELWILRQAGKYSYAMYLFNIPVFYWVARLGLDPEADSSWLGSRLITLGSFCFVAVTACALCAVASWYLVEKNFLSLKRYFRASPARLGH